MVIGTKQISRRGGGGEELEEEARQVTVSRRKNQEEIKKTVEKNEVVGFRTNYTQKLYLFIFFLISYAKNMPN